MYYFCRRCKRIYIINQSDADLCPLATCRDDLVSYQSGVLEALVKLRKKNYRIAYWAFPETVAEASEVRIAFHKYSIPQKPPPNFNIEYEAGDPEALFYRGVFNDADVKKVANELLAWAKKLPIKE